MSNRLNACLTATSNPYLAGGLPLVGQIELLEIAADGSLVRGVWRTRLDDGTFGSPVEVRDPQFVHLPSTRPGDVVSATAAALQARATVAVQDLLDTLDEVESLSARARDIARAVLDAVGRDS